jgi:hypothetical protein
MNHSRIVEDGGFVVAVLIALAYGLAEALASVGFRLGTCEKAGFPWGLTVIVCALALPKTLGRASAGAVWTAIATRLGGKPPMDPGVTP